MLQSIMGAGIMGHMGMGIMGHMGMGIMDPMGHRMRGKNAVVRLSTQTDVHCNHIRKRILDI